MFSVRIIFTV